MRVCVHPWCVCVCTHVCASVCMRVCLRRKEAPTQHRQAAAPPWWVHWGLWFSRPAPGWPLGQSGHLSLAGAAASEGGGAGERRGGEEGREGRGRLRDALQLFDRSQGSRTEAEERSEPRG